MPVTLLPQALTTLANLQERLGISGSDDKLKNIINRVSRFIEDTIDRKLMARNYDGSTTHAGTSIAAENPLFFDWQDFVKTSRGYELYLPAWPIQKGGAQDITFELAYLSERNSSGETYATANIAEWTDYILEKEEGTILFINHPIIVAGYPDVRIYRLKATLGFTSIPPAVEMACLELCEMMYLGGKGVTSERLGSWSKTYDLSANEKMVRNALGAYCRYSL